VRCEWANLDRRRIHAGAGGLGGMA
jgi:hypothetical protein